MSYFTRELTQADAGQLFRLTSDPTVTRYLGFRTHLLQDETSKLIRSYSSGPGRWVGVFDGMPWAERLIGVMGAERQDHSATVAIYFSPRARGAGRPASLTFVRWIFDNPEVQRVWAHCHIDNVPVQRVLERMGATREGRMRKYAVFPNISPELADCYLYSLLRNEVT